MLNLEKERRMDVIDMPNAERREGMGAIRELQTLLFRPFPILPAILPIICVEVGHRSWLIR